MPWELADRAAGVARLGVPLISAPGWALSQQNNSQLQLRIISGEITAPRMLEVCRGVCVERVLGWAENQAGGREVPLQEPVSQ